WSHVADQWAPAPPADMASPEPDPHGYTRPPSRRLAVPWPWATTVLASCSVARLTDLRSFVIWHDNGGLVSPTGGW
ncbi:hypothetical protein, partial [Plantactinospora sp. CA-290183]|uniref:hypothetical protein n=1 Tax=Plantactinospora sp. CA-290183 TaxID=3240006 RepID=UPI003D8AD240